WRLLLAVNAERLKFSRWHVDFFFAQDFIMLLHFQFAGLAFEVPGSALFQWRGDYRLRRAKLNELAVEIHARPARNPMFAHCEQIGVGDRPRPVHFKLK